jgi:hypothetical protein
MPLVIPTPNKNRINATTVPKKEIKNRYGMFSLLISCFTILLWTRIKRGIIEANKIEIVAVKRGLTVLTVYFDIMGSRP